MTEQQEKKITDADIQRAMIEATSEIVREQREEIIKRAKEKIEKQFRK